LIYLDASAIVTLLSGRTYAAVLRTFLANHPGVPMATSTVGFVETVRTMDRIGDFPRLMDDLSGTFTEVLVTEEVRNAAALLPAGVRTLDAIHIASAQAIGTVLQTLVAYDKRLLDTARAVGLPTSAPGLENPVEE
jgi:predicted nucleic acid-binding protein